MPVTHAAVIYDNSGSMYHGHGPVMHPIIPSLPECMDSLAADLKAKGVTTTFHVFSTDVASGDNLKSILAREKPRGTNIAIGFRAMVDSFKHNAEHVVVVFVSDGDDNSDGAVQMRRTLPKLRETCTLLTVAVGASFPTTTVLNDLYGKYHTSPDKSLPLVLPIDPNAANCKEVMLSIQAQLAEIIVGVSSDVPRKLVTVQDLDAMDSEAIHDQCVRWYNECSVKCLLQGPLPEKIALVEECKARLNAADDLLRKGMSTASMKPLASNIRKNVSMYHLTGIREKLNVILAQLNKGRVFEQLSDAEKSEFLSFASNKIGAHSSKAVKYHGADMKRAVESLKKKIRGYTASEFDQRVVETVYLCSQAEIWEDAKANPQLFEKIDSMADILNTVAFVGRALQLLPIPECAQINPWLVAVSGMPTVAKNITTHDLYCTGKGKLRISGEDTNNILILGGCPDSMEVETYTQTFTICGWMCYHKDARLAMVGAVLLYLLKGELQEWKVDELSLLKSIVDLHTPANSRWWHEYCAMLQTDPRKCLVTESGLLPPSIRCQGLNKFILAVWTAVVNGKNYDFAALRDLMLAFVTEFLGRCKIDRFSLKQHLKVEYQRSGCSVDAMCAAVIARASSQHICMQAVMHTLQLSVAEMLQCEKGEAVVHVDSASLSKLQHFNLTLADINTVFLNLASMCKVQNWQSISDDELVKALHVASTNFGSMGRNSLGERQLATTDIKEEIAASLAADAKLQFRSSLIASARERIVGYLHAQHVGLPRVIPSEFIRRYYAETGRNVEKDYLVNPKTGLSAVACCYPSCSLYLTIPAGNEHQQRSIVKAHLNGCCKALIPGLHECVAVNMEKPASEVLKIVKEGSALKPPFPSRSFGKQRFDKRQLQLQERRQHKQLNAAINSYEDGDTQQLYHLIVQMQESLSCKCWSYAAFKEAFDAKYA